VFKYVDRLAVSDGDGRVALV
jgi:lactate dehydrogenase-like 2-hydroxyacid dehydrogenase